MKHKAYKFRLYPNIQQEHLIQKTFGCSRFIFNHFLDKAIKDYESVGKMNSQYANIKELPNLKLTNSWLKEVDSISLQASVEDLNVSFKNFFNKTSEFPKFKTKHKSRRSYKTKMTNDNINILDKKNIKLPKLGVVKFKQHRKIEGRIINVTISQNASGHYFVSILVEQEIKEKPKTNKSVGIDLGLESFVITSDKEIFENQKYLEKSARKLAKEQKILSRRYEQAKKDKKDLDDAKNYQKQKLKVAKIHNKIVNQRLDYLHKLSTYLINEYDVICVEDLNISGMMKNKHLSKSIVSVSWHKFLELLNYKAEWYGKEIIKIDRFFPSSKTCSSCGNVNHDLKLKDRAWTCECGVNHNRDINAAINILNQGLIILNN